MTDQMRRDDPTNLAGISSVLGDDSLGEIDLLGLEKEIVNGRVVDAVTIDYSDQYASQIEKLTRTMAVDDGIVNIFDEDDNDNFDDNDNDNFDDKLFGDDFDVESFINPRSDSDKNRLRRSKSKMNSTSFTAESSHKGNDNNNYDPLNDYQNGSSYGNTHDPYLRKITDEQNTQDEINDIFQDYDTGTTDDLQQIMESDDKDVLLGEIDMLRDILIDDDTNIDSVKEVTKKNSYREIRDAHKALLIKNDSNRCCGLAEECILSLAHGLEYCFDGQNEWFGRKLNIVGWHSTVKVKLRRMRYETAKLVRDVISDYGIGGMGRLALELIPSLILYSRRRIATDTDNLSTDEDYRDAIGKINSI